MRTSATPDDALSMHVHDGSQSLEAVFDALLLHGHHDDVVFLAECVAARGSGADSVSTAAYYLARGYYSMGRVRTSYEVLRKYAPSGPHALYLLAKCCFETERFDEARAVLLGEDPSVPPSSALVAEEQMRERFGASAPFAFALLARVQTAMCASHDAADTAWAAVRGNPFLWSAVQLYCTEDRSADPHSELLKLYDWYKRRGAEQCAKPAATTSVPSRMLKTPRGGLGARQPNVEVLARDPTRFVVVRIQVPVPQSEKLVAPGDQHHAVGHLEASTPDVYVHVEAANVKRVADMAPAAPKKNMAAQRRNARSGGATGRLAAAPGAECLSRASSVSSVGSSTAGAQQQLISQQRMTTRSNSRAAQQHKGGGAGADRHRSAALHQSENMRWVPADSNRRGKRTSNTSKENTRRTRVLGSENRSGLKPVKIEDTDMLDYTDKSNLHDDSKLSESVEIAIPKHGSSMCGDLLMRIRDLIELQSLLSTFKLDEVIERTEDAQRNCLHTQLCRAKAYYEKTMYEKSVCVYAQVERSWPHNTVGMEFYSTALWQLQRAHELSALAQRLVENEPHAPQSWCAAGNCYSLHKEHELAIRMLNRAVTLSPGMSYAYTLLGHEYRAINELDKAVAMFSKSAHLDRKNYASWYGLALVHYSREELPLALCYTKRALEVHPRNSVLLCHLGLLLAARGRHDAAMRTLDSALEIAPDNVMCRYRRAELLFAARRYDDALCELNKLKEVAPREASVYYLAGQVYKVKGQSHLAVMNFSWSTELDPRGEHSATLMASGRLDSEPVTALAAIDADDHVDADASAD